MGAVGLKASELRFTASIKGSTVAFRTGANSVSPELSSLASKEASKEVMISESCCKASESYTRKEES